MRLVQLFQLIASIEINLNLMLNIINLKEFNLEKKNEEGFEKNLSFLF